VSCLPVLPLRDPRDDRCSGVTTASRLNQRGELNFDVEQIVKEDRHVCVVVISSACLSGERMLAESLAEELGYRCIDPAVVVERAAAWGAPHDELWEALLEPPTPVDRLLHKRRIHLALLQAALVEEIRPGDVVCYGNLGELLSITKDHALRVRVIAPIQFRVNLAWESLRLSSDEALTYIRNMDRKREMWLRYVYGANWREAPRQHVVFNIERIDLHEASYAIVDHVSQQPGVAGGSEEQAVLTDLALASKIKATLALDSLTAHLDLDVEADGGLVRIRGNVPSMQELVEVQRLSRRVPGVVDLDIEEVAIGSPEVLSFFSTKHLGLDGPEPLVGRRWRPWRPARAWLMLGFILCFVVVYSLTMGKLTSTLATLLFREAHTMGTFVGIVTDTRCGRHHVISEAAPKGACAQSCVRLGSKYALLADKDLYVLSDQRTAERFAGQNVRIAGALDMATKTLQIESIMPVS
jgi:cytidylate kinase